ncbi:MAG TPA: DNA polymerase IV [Miltoncostaeaceae bacterium]|nr:DNA polymerase IV [Miltoncostaeaceae bacterium]
MPSGATILHADLDAFYASVEQRDDRRLRGRPVIVGGGVVLAASYEARAAGVHSAMGGRRARRLCPEAIVVEPRWTAYVEASRAVFRVFERTSPLVEGLSIDEAFLDVRGLERIAGSPAEIAADLRRRVREEVGLPITVGVATTKFLAKVASAVAKPDGLLVVPAGGERAFLHPLPVEALWGVGPATAGRLRARGLATVGQVARLDETALVALLGQAVGRKMHALAHNRDPRPVRRGRGRRRSVGSQCARDFTSRPPEAMDRTLVALADRVARRTRRSGRIGRTIVLRMRYGDYTRAARSRTLPDATADTRAILAAARELLDEARPAIERRGLTLLGIALTNLDGGGPVQLVLPIDGERHRALDAAVDRVRERFGTTSLTRASLSGEHRGLAPWLPPD